MNPMKSCSHECVCRHLIFLGSDPCAITKACKFFDEPKEETTKRPYKKRIKSDAPLHETIDDSGVTEKQFKTAKIKIANAKQNNKLNENQKSALKGMKGLRFKGMSAAKKQQIINIADDL